MTACQTEIRNEIRFPLHKLPQVLDRRSLHDRLWHNWACRQRPQYLLPLYKVRIMESPSICKLGQQHRHQHKCHLQQNPEHQHYINMTLSLRMMKCLFNSLLCTLCVSNLLLILSNMVESLGALQLKVQDIRHLQHSCHTRPHKHQVKQSKFLNQGLRNNTLLTVFHPKLAFLCGRSLGTQLSRPSFMSPPMLFFPSQVDNSVIIAL